MNKKKEFVVEKKFSVLDAFRAFLLMIVAIIGAGIVYSVVLEILASSKNISTDEMSKTLTGQISSQVISTLLFIVFFFIYSKCVKVKTKHAFSDGQKISLLPISIAMVLAIICIFLMTPLYKLIDYWFGVPDAPIPIQEYMVSGFGPFMFGILIYALLPAIGEELVFRGIILRGLSSKYSGFVSILISSILFTLMHGSLQQTFYQLLMGILLGYMAYVGGSLLYPMILHFINNALVLLFTCFEIVPYLVEKPIYYNIFSMIFPILLGLLGLFLIVVLMWVLKYLRHKNFFRSDDGSESLEDSDAKKLGIKGLFSGTTYYEKLFIFAGLGVALVIWIVNTATLFAG